MPSLVLLRTPQGEALGEKYSLGSTPLVLGRSPDDCQIVLPQEDVSRKHAQICLTQGVCYIEDLKSRNKTFVNNREIVSRTALKDGDRVKICGFMFCYRDEKAQGVNKPQPKPGDEIAEELIEEEDQPNTTTTVEATLKRLGNKQVLEVQPSDKLRAILAISNVISRTFEIRKLLPQIAEELLTLFRQADRCFLIEYVPETDRLIPTLVKSRLPTTTNERFSSTIVRKCIHSLESYLSEDASSDKNIGFAQSISDFRIRSVMCVPLVSAENKPLGVIQLDSQDRTKRFSKDDLQLLVCVANQAAIAIENARMHSELVIQHKFEEENKAASKVQRGFLPQKLPEIPGYEFFSHYVSARTVGGDYYDFVPLPDGRYAILLGDVSGKGVPAALLMARVSGEAKICILTEPTVAEAITKLNDQLLQTNLEDRYITLAAVILDPDQHQATLVNAGHIPPAVFDPHSPTLTVCVPEEVSGFPVGWVPGFAYESVTIPLEVGQTLILFTDGILDAESANGTRFGEEGVQAVIKRIRNLALFQPKQVGEAIITGVRQHALNHPQFDDIALVCFGRVNEHPTVDIESNNSSVHEIELK